MKFMGRVSFTALIGSLLLFCVTQTDTERYDLQDIASVIGAANIPNASSDVSLTQ